MVHHVRCNSTEQTSKTQVAHQKEFVNSLLCNHNDVTNEPILVTNNFYEFIFNARMLITCDQPRKRDLFLVTDLDSGISAHVDKPHAPGSPHFS